jgi:Fe-S oxidoreductase
MPENWLKDSTAQHGLHRCDRCGSCVAVCPMREVYPGFARRFAPRTTITRLRLNGVSGGNGELAEALGDEALWMCLACEACLNVCPQGVNYRDFVEDMRRRALEAGMSGLFAECSRCGRPYLPRQVVEALRKYLPGEESRELLTTCPKCRKRVYSMKVKPRTLPGAKG